MSLQPGYLLHDRYEIVRLVKSGGMGSVCEARDTNLANSPCAIKEILESAVEGPDGEYIRATFEKEMRFLAGLDHPGIPKVRDFFRIGDRCYIVMDYVSGSSLEEETVEHAQVTGLGLPPGKVVGDVIQLLEIVSYLHGLTPPMLHRDIKPANIIRDDKSGRIKLVDFGLAKSFQALSAHTQTMVGTLGFCAPEQLSGKPETRSDLYSVASTLYQMLTGNPPQFSYDPLELNLPGLRPGLDAIIHKASQPKPCDRFANAEEMAAALRKWQRVGAAAGSAAPSTALEAQPKASKWAWAAVAGMALGIGLLFGRVAAGPPAEASTLVASTATPPPLAAAPVLTPSPPATSTLNHPKITPAAPQGDPGVPIRYVGSPPNKRKVTPNPPPKPPVTAAVHIPTVDEPSNVPQAPQRHHYIPPPHSEPAVAVADPPKPAHRRRHPLHRSGRRRGL